MSAARTPTPFHESLGLTEQRRLARLRKYPLSKSELLVWLLRAYEGQTFEQIGELLDMTVSRVREVDRSMTARAQTANGQWRPDET